MADETLSFKVRGVEKLQEFLKSLPYGTKKAAIEAAAEYLVGDENHGLKYEPERVEHGEGNPYQWQTEKQRRAFFATNGCGRGIPTVRTHDLSNGWTYVPLNNGYDCRITNKTTYATYIQGKTQQVGHAADLWRRVGKIVSDNTAGAMRAAQQAVDRYVKSHQQ